jgi:hypothetical protein
MRILLRKYTSKSAKEKNRSFSFLSLFLGEAHGVCQGRNHEVHLCLKRMKKKNTKQKCTPALSPATQTGEEDDREKARTRSVEALRRHQTHKATLLSPSGKHQGGCPLSTTCPAQHDAATNFLRQFCGAGGGEDRRGKQHKPSYRSAPPSVLPVRQVQSEAE